MRSIGARVDNCSAESALIPLTELRLENVVQVDTDTGDTARVDLELVQMGCRMYEPAR